MKGDGHHLRSQHLCNRKAEVQVAEYRLKVSWRKVEPCLYAEALQVSHHRVAVLMDQHRVEHVSVITPGSDPGQGDSVLITKAASHPGCITPFSSQDCIETSQLDHTHRRLHFSHAP